MKSHHSALENGRTANQIDVPEHCWMGSRLGWAGFDGKGDPSPLADRFTRFSQGNGGVGNGMTPSKAEQKWEEPECHLMRGGKV
jgi:hypothetical protein